MTLSAPRGPSNDYSTTATVVEGHCVSVEEEYTALHTMMVAKTTTKKPKLEVTSVPTLRTDPGPSSK